MILRAMSGPRGHGAQASHLFAGFTRLVHTPLVNELLTNQILTRSYLSSN